jgi:polar amino acid transport system substrate-binding protein
MYMKIRKTIFLVVVLILGVFLTGNVTVIAAGEQQTVVIGTNAEYPPFEYLDSEGNLTGFDYELMEAIAAAENFKLEWRDMPFDSLIGAMEAGNIEMIAATIAPTKEREKSVDFSDVYYTYSQSIITRNGETIKGFAGLSGKRVAVLEGSQSDFIVSGENTDYGVVEKAEPVRFKNAASTVMELKNGGVDAVLIDTFMAEIYCTQNEGISFEVIPGTDEDTVFCIEKGNHNLQDQINRGLAKVRVDGVYDKLYTKYFLSEDSDAQATMEQSENNGFLETLRFIFLEENRYQFYLNGVRVTILVSLLSVLMGMLIGLFVALVRMRAEQKKRETILSRLMSIYVDVIRGTPSVLQLMIVYFAVFHSQWGYVAAVVSFGINSGAYVSEVIRGGIVAIDRGQTEAGRSLGLGYGDTMRFIIIPQAVKNILPAMGNEFIQLIKETSILGYVGIMDLTKASSYVSSRTYQMFIPLLAAGIMYYLLVKILTILMGRLERRLRESD